jgi:hypothetical protein
MFLSQHNLLYGFHQFRLQTCEEELKNVLRIQSTAWSLHKAAKNATRAWLWSPHGLVSDPPCSSCFSLRGSGIHIPALEESQLTLLRKLPNARLKKSVISKRATLKKLYNCPKEASARPHSLQHQERSRIEVQWLRGVVLLLLSLLLHLAPTPPAAAEQQLYIGNLYERILSQRSMEPSTKISCDNSHCMWR